MRISEGSALAGRLADLHGPQVPLVRGMALLAAGTTLTVAGPSFGRVIAGHCCSAPGPPRRKGIPNGSVFQVSVKPSRTGRPAASWGSVAPARPG